MVKNEQVIYNESPVDVPIPGKTLKLVSTELDVDSVPLNGGVLVKNQALSLDPYQRGRMRDPKIQSYAPAYELGKPMMGYGVGVIERSEHKDYKIGQTLYGFTTFETYTVVPADKLSSYRVLSNKEGLPPTLLVGSVGMSGQTSWYGLEKIGRPKKGETIFGTFSTSTSNFDSVLMIASSVGCIGCSGTDSRSAGQTCRFEDYRLRWL
jgi:hypothetical protein